MNRFHLFKKKIDYLLFVQQWSKSGQINILLWFVLLKQREMKVARGTEIE